MIVMNVTANDKIHFDIPPQRAALSLTAFANQAHLTLIIPFELVKGKKTNGLVGDFQIEEGIKILLDGTGLSATVSEDNQLKITVGRSSGGQEEMNKNFVKKTGIFALFTALFAGSPAQAQDQSTRQTGVLEEIVVTAQKREQNLQDVGISITAFGGEQLQELNLNNTNELVYLTPGLTLGNPGGEGNITSLSLRGIGQGDFADHQESPVAVYSDEVYNAYMGATNTTLFDQERVEVLRGPQGTLFGRNASAGLVHYISRKPSQEMEGYGNFSFAEHSHLRFEGAVSGPITENISGRVSGFVNNHNAYVDNIGTGNDGNEADTWAIRGQVLFQPNENFDALFKFEYYETDITQWYFETLPATVNALGQAVAITPPAGSEILDGDPFQVNNDGNVGLVAARGASPEGLARDGVSGSMRLDWELDNGMTITSLTAMSEHNKFFNQESDGQALSLVTFATDTNAQQFSQEIRLAGETDNLRWLTGFYYLDYDNDIVLDVGFFAPSAFFSDQLVKTENWSIFGHVEWDFAPDWTLIAGLRYLDEKKELEASGSVAGFIVGLPTTLTTTFDKSISPLAVIEEDDVAANIQLNWHPNDNLMLYGGISRGVKAGGFNATFGAPGVTSGTTPYSKETPITYEVGFKSTLLDGRAQWNTSFYYYDYQNYQAFAFVALSQLVFNTDAEVYGIDSNLLISPFDGLNLNFGINIMDTEAKNVVNPGGFSENRTLPNAPDVQLTGMARYSWPAMNGTMAIQGDFNYQSKNSFTLFDDPATSIDGYIVGNARLSYTSGDESWSAALFVKNIGDKEYVTSMANNAGFPPGLAHVQRFYARPRWFGGQVSYNWN
jgi:iron complex outermembrane recepter protein